MSPSPFRRLLMPAVVAGAFATGVALPAITLGTDTAGSAGHAHDAGHETSGSATAAVATDGGSTGHTTAGHTTAGHTTAGHTTAGHTTAGHDTAGGSTQAVKLLDASGKEVDVPLGHTHGGGACTTPVTEEQREAAQDLLDRTTKAIQKYQDIEVAKAEGFQFNAPPFKGVGAHWVNFKYFFDGHIADPDYPESLIYDGNTLQAAMFLMDAPDQPGPMIGGCLTPWHDHTNLCYDKPQGTPGSMVVGLLIGDKCIPGGTNFKTPAMLHVWLIPRPDGPFGGIET